ncbi:MAG: chemotaxis protein CheD [Planctomycetes bacterium]|nr:chemotaxis protein CheD [Planctomycetota bacterium]MCH7960716.1 chemotaxis protein CheD [Planctomycetota bacterium]
MGSPAATYTGTEVGGKIVVGVADLAVTSDPSTTLVTYALGSCIGVTLYDPVAKVAGMLHFMLPNSKLNADKAKAMPAMFADTGVPMLFKAAYDLGAEKRRLIVCAVGGAEVLADDGHFKIGSRNRTFLRKIFWKNNILLSGDDTGGSISRTLSLVTADGTVVVRHKGKEHVLWPQ